ncbi:MAG: hypothetical protein RIB52_00155 [Erythrobacter sp.]|uniref:hypothetical protein n=1 Tax=Erythrobacter sp. TaxID=1042 RepID=UPI0032EB3DAE
MLAVFALVTVGLQMDRQSASTAQLAALVPQPFRHTAQARIAAASIQGASPEQALEEAQRLIVRRPMPAQSIRLLALAQNKAGAPGEGLISIQLAARRGWRDVAAQEAMARLALSAGDGPEAARRYMALFVRPESNDETMRQLSEALFALPGEEAQDALAAIIADSERWNVSFLRRGLQVMSARRFAALIEESASLGARHECAALMNVTQRVAREDPAAAERIRRVLDRQCP